MPRQKHDYGENHLHYLTRSTYRRTRLFDSDRFRQHWCGGAYGGSMATPGGWAALGYYLAGTPPLPQVQHSFWLGTLRLQARVFVSTLGQNFADEFKSNGCFAGFLSNLADRGSEDASPPGGAPEDIVKQAGETGAMTYAVMRGVAVPEGVLAVTEQLAGAVALLPFIASEFSALNAEWTSLHAGGCK